MLSDHPDMKNRVPTRKLLKDLDTQKRWSDEQKIEAVKTVMILGNVSHASAALKIPDCTLRDWRRTQWWKDLESELRSETNLQLSARLTKIVERSLDVVGDRLENGDFVVTKFGGVVRKPVSMRDAHVVAKDMIDKADKLAKTVDQSPHEATMQERMLKLAETFAALAVKDKQTIEATVVSVQDVTGQE